MPCSARTHKCLARNPGCAHLALVQTYQNLLTDWELQREAQNPGLYPSEVAEWEQSNPYPTFKRFLLWSRKS